MVRLHPVGMGGDYYAFSLPGRSIMSLYFLPLGATNQATSQSDDVHSVSITLRQKNKLKIVKQNMKAGSLWQYTAPVEETISVWIRDQLNKSINANERKSAVPVEVARVMVIASIRNVSISGVKKSNFGCFMPTPMIVDRCAHLINTSYYPSSSNVTSNVLLTAPSHLCPEDKIDIRSNTETKLKSILVKWNKDAEEITVQREARTKVFMINSQTTMMNVVSYGGEKGIFIHEIPEYSQWMTDPAFPIAMPDGFEGALYVIATRYKAKDNRSVSVQQELLKPSLHRLMPSPKTRLIVVRMYYRRYLPILRGEVNGTPVACIVALNRRAAPSPIFAKPTTTPPSTMIAMTTEEECLVDGREESAPMTQGASLRTLSNNLLAICICLMIYNESKH
ncbi:unnamed protein product [Litomosoides sigmodontis]|uniref:Uncharacterized protein n=1 Tax=Litomosoides sigmodontis TaxID=42156 RepID=A0A3P6TB38_LITSI|nr:unnamed protein product [Litomosoides sigmodontis]